MFDINLVEQIITQYNGMILKFGKEKRIRHSTIAKVLIQKYSASFHLPFPQWQTRRAHYYDAVSSRICEL